MLSIASGQHEIVDVSRCMLDPEIHLAEVVEESKLDILQGCMICTIENGYNGGRVYRFRMQGGDLDRLNGWIDCLKLAVESAHKKAHTSNLIGCCQVQ